MDVRLVVKLRLEELGLEQKDLAAAARVTESYISQLLTRRKAPPAPGRTDIYDRMGKFLKLPKGQLARMAEIQHKETLIRNLEGAPAPLLKDVRKLALRKCSPETRTQVRPIFEKEPFGELERLVTRTLLDAVKKLARKERDNEVWLRQIARPGGRTCEEMRVMVSEFLEADVLDLSAAQCRSFLDPIVDSWEIDLKAFAMEIVLNRRLAPGRARKFGFVETESEEVSGEEAGFKEFLRDASLSGDASGEEVEFLRRLRFNGKKPTPLYYYRELQNLRDPLHFRTEAPARPGRNRRVTTR